jgi:hypothetical protein
MSLKVEPSELLSLSKRPTTTSYCMSYYVQDSMTYIESYHRIFRFRTRQKHNVISIKKRKKEKKEKRCVVGVGPRSAENYLVCIAAYLLGYDFKRATGTNLHSLKRSKTTLATTLKV